MKPATGDGAAKKNKKRSAARKARERRVRNRRIRLAGLCAVALGCAVLLFAVFFPGANPAVDDAEPTLSSINNEPSASPLPTSQLTPSPIPIAPTPTPAPTPEPTPALRSARIRTGGDFVIHDEILSSAYNSSAKAYDFAPMLSMVANELSDADFTVVNVDGVMQGGSKKTYRGYPEFNTPPELLMALKESGVDMLTLANNHALDYFFDGLKATIASCEKYGMDFVGGARSQAERDTPVVREINGISVGFLNYTDNLNRKEKYSDKNAVVYGIRRIQDANVKADIDAARAAGAEVVIVYMHWGTEYRTKPDSNQRKYAKQIARAGADLIIGGHPHMVQPIVWIETEESDGSVRRTLCAYSLGNFLADKRSEKRDTGIILEITIRETAPGAFEIAAPVYIPTYIWRYGSGSGSYKFRVVVCDRVATDVPDKMTDRVARKVREAYDGVCKLIGSDAARVRDIP